MSYFNKRKESPDGYAPRCRSCTKMQRRSWRQETDYDGPEIDLSAGQKRDLYSEAILRMYKSGIMSKESSLEALKRVRND